MKWAFVLVGLSGCLLAGAFGDDRKDAGEACRADRECSSGVCYGGLCEAGSCDGGDADCPTNYRCVYYDGDPLFGTGAGHYCALSCAGGCPARWECTEEDQTCYFEGPEVTVTADVAMPSARMPVTFTAAITPDLETTYAWRFEDPSGNPVGSTAMGATCEQAFDPGDYRALVDWATPGWGNTAGMMVHVCAVAGDPCETPDACCAGLACTDGACQ